jgi:hypothetical protein
VVFNATLNNISVLLVEEIGVPGENHQPATSHGQTLSHNVVSNTTDLLYNYARRKARHHIYR